jgi:tryptophan-rich sensory protein
VRHVGGGVGRFVIDASVPRADRRAFFANVVVTLAAAVVLNGLIAGFGLNATTPQRWPSFAPPGAAIGGIWIVLFAALGVARGIASRIGEARAVTGLIVLCLAYPLYTHALRGHATELAGNIISFAYAAWLIARLRDRAPVAALLVAAVAVWIAFATALVFGLVELNGWAT